MGLEVYYLGSGYGTGSVQPGVWIWDWKCTSRGLGMGLEVYYLGSGYGTGSVLPRVWVWDWKCTSRGLGMGLEVYMKHELIAM